MLPIWMDSFSNGPGTNPHLYEHWRITPALHSLKQEVVGNVGSVLWVVMGTIGVVMLIACTNVANLLLVRAEARQQELSIRAALGAGRGAHRAGTAVRKRAARADGRRAWGSARRLQACDCWWPSARRTCRACSEISLDARSIAFTFVLSVLSGLFFGSIPAWKYARRQAVLGTGGSARTASASRERHRSRNVLVVAQVAMALVLLVSAVLMIRTFQQLRTVDPGFTDAEHVQTMRISIPDAVIAESADGHAHREQHCRQVAIDSRRELGWICAWACPWRAWNPTGTRFLWKARAIEHDDPPAALLQLRLSGILPGSRHAHGGRPRFHLERDLQLPPGGDRFRELCARVVGLAGGGHRQAHPAV